MFKNFNQSSSRLGLTLHAAGACVIAAVVVAYYSLIYAQIEAQAVVDGRRIETLEGLLRESGVVQSEHNQLQVEVAELEKIVETYRSRLTPPLVSTQLSTTIRQAAKTHGVEISQLKVGHTTTHEKHRRTDLELHCDGSFASICAFVDQLGRLRWVADFTQLRLETSADGFQRKLVAKLTVFSDHLDTESELTSS